MFNQIAIWLSIFRHLNFLEYTPLARICKAAKEAVRRRNLEQLSPSELSYAVFRKTNCTMCFRFDPENIDTILSCDYCPFRVCWECRKNMLDEAEDPWFGQCEKCKSIVCYFCSNRELEHLAWCTGDPMLDYIGSTTCIRCL